MKRGRSVALAGVTELHVGGVVGVNLGAVTEEDAFAVHARLSDAEQGETRASRVLVTLLVVDWLLRL
jgi:hypothetical protein